MQVANADEVVGVSGDTARTVAATLRVEQCGQSMGICLMSDAASIIDKALSRFANPADFCRSLTTTYLAMGEGDRSRMALVLIAEIAAREISARSANVAMPVSGECI
ncbi:hypothetical protein PE067_08210 [Paracoccus sp. DMF-8]|uniref:hypothetical protein n=1 Tax=Paracoccus sp. DMF-8 TaxID=3019445 RepID=UPI0023E79316|nr:hypothetical protein [Paracoccus sp. DMF-8]MDF3606111.1 hypothetical protein [Paracoccus sp. DMF-8]